MQTLNGSKINSKKNRHRAKLLFYYPATERDSRKLIQKLIRAIKTLSDAIKLCASLDFHAERRHRYFPSIPPVDFRSDVLFAIKLPVIAVNKRIFLSTHSRFLSVEKLIGNNSEAIPSSRSAFAPRRRCVMILIMQMNSFSAIFPSPVAPFAFRQICACCSALRS